MPFRPHFNPLSPQNWSPRQQNQVFRPQIRPSQPKSGSSDPKSQPSDSNAGFSDIEFCLSIPCSKSQTSNQAFLTPNQVFWTSNQVSQTLKQIFQIQNHKIQDLILIPNPKSPFKLKAHSKAPHKIHINGASGTADHNDA